MTMALRTYGLRRSSPDNDSGSLTKKELKEELRFYKIALDLFKEDNYHPHHSNYTLRIKQNKRRRVIQATGLCSLIYKIGIYMMTDAHLNKIYASVKKAVNSSNNRLRILSGYFPTNGYRRAFIKRRIKALEHRLSKKKT